MRAIAYVQFITFQFRYGLGTKRDAVPFTALIRRSVNFIELNVKMNLFLLMSDGVECNYLAQERGRRRTCEVGNFNYDSIKKVEYLVRISHSQLLNNVSGPWVVNQLMSNTRYLV
jgi:hypothetical protein